MPIYIQREGRRGMAQIALDGFDVIPVLQGQDRISVTQVVDPGVGRADLRGEFLEYEVFRGGTGGHFYCWLTSSPSETASFFAHNS